MLRSLLFIFKKGFCWLWNWIGKMILLLVKFIFWVWGAVLASILVLAIAFFLLSHGIKAFDQTRFAPLFVTEMGMGREYQNVPDVSFSVEEVELDIIEE